MSLSEPDRTVLAALRENGRLTLREVAAAADLPTKVVAERVQALEDRGVVTGYTVDVDGERIGEGELAVFEVETNQSLLPTVRKHMLEERRLTTVYEVTGGSDLVAIGRYPEAEAIEDQRRALYRIPGVVAVSVSVVNRVHRDFGPPPLDTDGDG